jgi:hypothetical protein
MAFKVTTIKEATQEQGLKLLVHGPPGAGKTVLAASTGCPKQTMIISAEAGLLSLRRMVREYPQLGLNEIAVVTISGLDELQEVYKFLRKGEHDYKWVCLDSISEIAEQVLNREQANAKDGRAAYGNLNNIIPQLLRAFRDLPMNVYFSCKQEREKDEETGRTLYSPSMPGKRLTQGISYIFDEVFALRVERDADGEPYHTLQCKGDARYEIKDRSGVLDTFEKPSLQYIYNKIMGADAAVEAAEEVTA